MCDLIKTINDDEEVQNFSEDSDVEIEVKYVVYHIKNIYIRYTTRMIYQRVFINYV